MRNVLALILGGGQGTRLYPLTKLRAKPAVPIGGKYRLIDIPVSNCINSAIQKIYVLTQFNSASLNRHISQTYRFSPFSEGFVEILAAQQTPERSDWFQGTADAVRQYLSSIQEFKVSEFLILSGDHLYRMDYRPFIEQHRHSDADITIPVVAVEHDKASDFGLMKINEHGQIVEFKEKPKDDDLLSMQVDTRILGLDETAAKKRPYIASMGIYVFKRRAMIDLLTRNLSQQDFGKEIIPSAIGDYKIDAYLFDGYWEDIGTILAFYDANMGLVKFPLPEFNFYDVNAPIFTRQRFLPPSKIRNSQITESLICEGCIIEQAQINSSIVGIRAKVEPNTKISNSLIMGNDFYQSLEDIQTDRDKDIPSLGIGEGSEIKNAIIDKNARIGKNVKIINANGVNDGERPDQGVWFRNGIICITKNSMIPDNTVI
jgi:glucose-1-phosphate adenylyltransferase